MSNRPRTIHLQKALDKIKKENINTGVSSEYLLLLEQMSILTDINEAYGEQIGGINEVIAEMEQSRRLLEQKFDQHLESGKELSSMMRDIHERIMNPDDGLVVRSREIQGRVDALEKTKEIAEQETKERRTLEMEEQKESAREKRDKNIKIMYIISISFMALLVFGKEVAIPLIKFLLTII